MRLERRRPPGDAFGTSKVDVRVLAVCAMAS
jgi:hypothetical protein